MVITTIKLYTFTPVLVTAIHFQDYTKRLLERTKDSYVQLLRLEVDLAFIARLVLSPFVNVKYQARTNAEEYLQTQWVTCLQRMHQY